MVGMKDVQDVEQGEEAEDEETPLVRGGGECADETHDDDGEGHKGCEEDVGEGESGGEEDHDDDQWPVDGPLNVADPLNITTNSEYPVKSKEEKGIHDVRRRFGCCPGMGPGIR